MERRDLGAYSSPTLKCQRKRPSSRTFSARYMVAVWYQMGSPRARNGTSKLSAHSCGGHWMWALPARQEGSNEIASIPTWTRLHCGHVRTPATFRRLDNERLL